MASALQAADEFGRRGAGQGARLRFSSLQRGSSRRRASNVDQVTQVIGFVLSKDGFGDQPKVINGASDLLVEVLGDAGRHARIAVGANAMPAR